MASLAFDILFVVSINKVLIKQSIWANFETTIWSRDVMTATTSFQMNYLDPMKSRNFKYVTLKCISDIEIL